MFFPDYNITLFGGYGHIFLLFDARREEIVRVLTVK